MNTQIVLSGAKRVDMANQFPIHKARPIVYEQRMVRTKDVSKFVHASTAGLQVNFAFWKQHIFFFFLKPIFSYGGSWMERNKQQWEVFGAQIEVDSDSVWKLLPSS